jgi:hypothetical protein
MGNSASIHVQTTLRHPSGVVAFANSHMHYHEIAELPMMIRNDCIGVARMHGLLRENEDVDHVVVRSISMSAAGDGPNLATRPDLWFPSFQPTAPPTLFVQAEMR